MLRYRKRLGLLASVVAVVMLGGVTAAEAGARGHGRDCGVSRHRHVHHGHDGRHRSHVGVRIDVGRHGSLWYHAAGRRGPVYHAPYRYGGYGHSYRRGYDSCRPRPVYRRRCW